MSEENMETNNEAAGKSDVCGKVKQVGALIDDYNSKIDTFIDKALSFISNHPWEAWLKAANCFIGKYLPCFIALAAVLSCVTGIVTAIKYDARISQLLLPICLLIPAFFSMHLAPKAMALPRSFIEKNEPEAMRPELLYIVKTIGGLGALLLAIYMLFQFNLDSFVAAIVLAVIGVLMVIITTHPEIVGIKAAYPTNCVEEIITILLSPVKIVLSLLTLIVGLATIGGTIYGITLWFSDGLEAASILFGAAMAPLTVPLCAYAAYLIMVCMIDIVRATVSIPRKLDELKQK